MIIFLCAQQDGIGRRRRCGIRRRRRMMEDQQILNSTKNHFLLSFGFWVNGSGDVWLSLSFTLMIWKLDKRGVWGIWDYGGSA